MRSSHPSPAQPSHPEAAGRSGLFPGNRRDGARLLSSALIITVIGLVNWVHPLGRAVSVLGAAFSLYGWLQYRQLTQ